MKRFMKIEESMKQIMAGIDHMFVLANESLAWRFRAKHKYKKFPAMSIIMGG